MVRIGDDTNAFGFKFLKVNCPEAADYTVTKAEIRINTIEKTVLNPVFPLRISLTRQETMTLNECCNECYMALYDIDGLKHTCEGSLTFPAKPKVV